MLLLESMYIYIYISIYKSELNIYLINGITK